MQNDHSPVKLAFMKGLNKGWNSIYLDMKRGYAHFNDLTEQDGLGVLGVFWTLSNSCHLYMPTCSQQHNWLTDQPFICLQETQPRSSLLKNKSADSDKNKHPKPGSYLMLFLPSLSANNPSHHPFCLLVLADMSACFSVSRARIQRNYTRLRLV